MPSVPTGTQPSGWDSGPPGATTAAGWSTVAPASSARGPLHDRQAPPPGGQRAARRHRRPLSGPQRAFQTRGCTPGYPPPQSEKCPSTAFLNSAGPARSAAPASASTAIERAGARSLGCCSEPTTAPGHRATGRVRGSSGSRSTAAPAISAFGPLHDRQAPPPGRQRAARRHRRPLSGPLSAFQTRGCTPGYPPKSERVPVNAVFSASLTPRDSPRLNPYLEQQFDTGAPSARRGTRQRFTASLTQRPHHRRCRFPHQPLKQATQERFRPQGRDHSELPSSGSSRPSD